MVCFVNRYDEDIDRVTKYQQVCLSALKSIELGFIDQTSLGNLNYPIQIFKVYTYFIMRTNSRLFQTFCQSEENLFII